MNSSKLVVNSPKTIMLTGATGTIGEAVATKLAASGARLRLVCPGRSRMEIEAGDRLLDKVKATAIDGDAKLFFVDLSSLADIRRMVDQYADTTDEALDVLINNAGLFGLGKRLSSFEGHELMLSVNFLAPFTLSLLLLDRLKASGQGRIVNVASEEYTDLKDFEAAFSDYDAIEKYSTKQYAFSKLALILFSQELADRLKNTNITVNAMHPGAVPSNMWKNLPLLLQIKISLFRWLAPLRHPEIIITPEETAKTYSYLSLSTELNKLSGKYFYREKEVELNSIALNRDYRLQIWNLASRLTGLSI